MGDAGGMLPILALVVFVIVVVGYLVVSRRVGDQPETRGSAILEWLGLTALTLLIGGAMLFTAATVLYFFAGRLGGMFGLVVLALFSVATPILWAVVIRRRMRRAPAHR